MTELTVLFKALADESRLRALHVLRKGELCVCQITELLELAPSTVSKHMSILRQAGLVESRKEGRWIYYQLANNEILGSEFDQFLQRQLSSTERGRNDWKSMKKILRCSPEELCRKQVQK